MLLGCFGERASHANGTPLNAVDVVAIERDDTLAISALVITTITIMLLRLIQSSLYGVSSSQLHYCDSLLLLRRTVSPPPPAITAIILLSSPTSRGLVLITCLVEPPHRLCLECGGWQFSCKFTRGGVLCVERDSGIR